MKPDLLVTNRLNGEMLVALEEGYTLHLLAAAGDRDAFLKQVAPRIRGVVTSGSNGIDGAVIRALPNLEIICCMSAGYEKVDVAAARERNVIVTHGVGINAASVADNALCLLLAVVRNLVPAIAYVREGGWPEKGRPPPTPTITGKRLGILGLGAIGHEIARRAAGFEMEILYHNRHKRSDVSFEYCSSLRELAEAADYLMVSCPGGDETFHMVDGGILAALGSRGVLINVARGPIVHTEELVAALDSGIVAGAGLDLVEDRPDLLERLLAMENVLITPHISAPTIESREVMTTQLRANLDAHFSGRPVLTPVP